MEKNTLTRLKEYLDFIGVSVSAFEKSVGMSNGSFSSQLKKGKTIGVDKLENILITYPELNPYWLLTGKGNMVMDDEEYAEAYGIAALIDRGKKYTHDDEKVIHSERDVFMEERLRSLERENELLRRMVDLLEKSQGTGDSDQMGGEIKQVG